MKQWLDQHAVALQWSATGASIVAAVVIVASVPAYQLFDSLRSSILGSGGWGIAVYAAAFIGLTLCCLPVWAMPFLAGALFGVIRGTIVASASCGLAAAVTFGIGRLLRRSPLRARLEASPRLRALEQTAAAADWRLVAAIRVSHFMPFGMQNYALGLTSIGFRSYLVTTLLVTLPGLLLQSYLGHVGYTSVNDWQQQSLADWQAWGMRLGGLLVLGAGVAYCAWLWRKVYGRLYARELERRVEVEAAAHAKRPTWRIDVIVPVAVAIMLSVTAGAVLVWQHRSVESADPRHASCNPGTRQSMAISLHARPRLS